MYQNNFRFACQCSSSNIFNLQFVEVKQIINCTGYVIVLHRLVYYSIFCLISRSQYWERCSREKVIWKNYRNLQKSSLGRASVLIKLKAAWIFSSDHSWIVNSLRPILQTYSEICILVRDTVNGKGLWKWGKSFWKLFVMELTR